MPPRVWMRTILRQDEEVFFDSHLDTTDACPWITPALKSTKQNKNSKKPQNWARNTFSSFSGTVTELRTYCLIYKWRETTAEVVWRPSSYRWRWYEQASKQASNHGPPFSKTPNRVSNIHCNIAFTVLVTVDASLQVSYINRGGNQCFGFRMLLFHINVLP